MVKYKISKSPLEAVHKIYGDINYDTFDYKTAVILGTGLLPSICGIDIDNAMPYRCFLDDVNPFHTVDDEMLFGHTKNNKQIIVLNKRFYYYEGYSDDEITYLIEILHHLGVKNLILTGPVGGINTLYEIGDFAVISDFINLMGRNPLIGKEDYIKKFPDMSQPYSNKIIKDIATVTSKIYTPTFWYDVVYAGMLGPSLETRAEYRMLKNLGADVVGMSTVPETIMANSLGMNVASINLITDECDPINLKVLELDDVFNTIKQSLPVYKEVISSLLEIL